VVATAAAVRRDATESSRIDCVGAAERAALTVHGRKHPLVAWRKTRKFHEPVEILVMTCDVCERDIGYEDERRARAHFRVSRHPNPGAFDDQDPEVVLCSLECLRAFATKLSTPGPASSASRGRAVTKLRR
jgi:hypothetical protein